MNYVLEQIATLERERSLALDKVHFAYQAERQKALTPVFEKALFIGITDDLPTKLPLVLETSVANFVADDGKRFSLLVDKKSVGELSEERNYIVGFLPAHLNEHTHSRTAMEFYINSMLRPSPILGNFATAKPIPNGLVKREISDGTTPSPL